MDSSRLKPERMEETLEGGQGSPRAVAPLEEEEEEVGFLYELIMTQGHPNVLLHEYIKNNHIRS